MLALPGITVRVRRRRGRDKWRKEVHFFDQWPLGTSHDYVNCFPPERRASALLDQQSAVFVDASPEYLLTPAAAPRAAQIVPHAKLVIILRVRLSPCMWYFLDFLYVCTGK